MLIVACGKEEVTISKEKEISNKLIGTWTLQSCYNTGKYIGIATSDTICDECVLLDLNYNKYTLTFTSDIKPEWSNIMTDDNVIIGTVVEKGKSHEYLMPLTIIDYKNENKFTIWGIAPYMTVVSQPNNHYKYFQLSHPQIIDSYGNEYGHQYLELYVIELTGNYLCVNFFLNILGGGISKWHIAYYKRTQ